MNREQIANKYNLIIDNHNDKMVINAMVAIKKHNMEKWIREFDEPNGFIMSSHSNISIFCIIFNSGFIKKHLFL